MGSMLNGPSDHIVPNKVGTLAAVPEVMNRETD